MSYRTGKKVRHLVIDNRNKTAQNLENYLEFIAHDKLRDKLNLKDGDIVSIEF